jgi:hypothetical protein
MMAVRLCPDHWLDPSAATLVTEGPRRGGITAYASNRNRFGEQHASRATIAGGRSARTRSLLSIADTALPAWPVTDRYTHALDAVLMVTDHVATTVPAYTTNKCAEQREPKPVVAVARNCVAAGRFSVKSTIHANMHELNDPLNSATMAGY